MGYKDFSPFGTKSIKIKFKCANCKNEVITEEVFIPKPNYSADNASDSHNSTEDYAYCENCGTDYNFSISVGYGDAFVDFDDLSDEDILEIEEFSEDNQEYYDDQIEAILQSNAYYQIINKEIENLKELTKIDLRNSNLQNTLYRQIFSGTITCLEDYLSSTIINKVFQNEEYFRNFITTNPKIKDRKFSLNEIYDQMENLTNIVKQELIDIIYHDLPKVKNLYQDTLKIEFPSIKDLMAIIKTRHDMVHRNGKNKEGIRIILSQENIEEVIQKVETFIIEIEGQLQNLG